MSKPLRQGISLLLTSLVVILIAVVVGGGLILVYKNLVRPKEATSPTQVSAPTRATEVADRTETEILKEIYEQKKDKSRPTPPKGFLIPRPDSVPSQFKLEFTFFTDSETVYHYVSSESEKSILRILEDLNEDYEKFVKTMLEITFQQYRVEQEFTFEGSEGVVFVMYKNGTMTDERVLALNRSGHLLRIGIQNSDWSSSENLLNLLKTLQPAP